MIHNIEWHREGYKNALDYLEREKTALARMQTAVNRLQAQVEFQGFQIAEAERMGKAAFDPERFLVKRSSSA